MFTGFGYQDYDGFARTFPQEQMTSAFGLSILWPYADPEGLITEGFRWYWGLDQGTYSTTIPFVIAFIYGAVQYAGPTLTAENVRKGLFSVPATQSPRTGQSGYGFTTGMPYPEYAAGGTDRALAFWDGEPTAQHAGRPARRPGCLPVRRRRQALHRERHAEEGAEVLRHRRARSTRSRSRRTTPTASCRPRHRARVVPRRVRQRAAEPRSVVERRAVGPGTFQALGEPHREGVHVGLRDHRVVVAGHLVAFPTRSQERAPGQVGTPGPLEELLRREDHHGPAAGPGT